MFDLSGPLSDTFLEIYLYHHYKKAKKLQTMARAASISLDDLVFMVKEDPENIEFKINLLSTITAWQ